MEPPVRVLSERQRAFTAALARVLVPGTRDLSPERWASFFAIIDSALATRPPGMVRLLGLFLVALRWLPLLRFGGRLDKLADGQQEAALRWFEDCPLAIVRTGFWGVKTLVFMGYYAQPEIVRGLDYAPSFAGNEKLHA